METVFMLLTHPIKVCANIYCLTSIQVNVSFIYPNVEYVSLYKYVVWILFEMLVYVR